MEVVVTTGATSRAKLQITSSPTNQHPVFYRPDALSVAQPTMSKHWMEKSHSMDLLTPSSPEGLWSLKAPVYIGGGLPCLSYQPSDDSTHTICWTHSKFQVLCMRILECGFSCHSKTSLHFSKHCLCVLNLFYYYKLDVLLFPNETIGKTPIRE